MSVPSSNINASLLTASPRPTESEPLSPLAEGRCPYHLLKQKQLQPSSLDTLFQAAKTMMNKEPQIQKCATLNTYGLFDIWSNEDTIVIYMDAPGLKKDNIDISVKDDRLYINANRTSDFEVEEQSIYSERHCKIIKQSILLPACVDVNSISSAYKDGVIIITMGKMKQNNMVVKKIPVTLRVCCKHF